MADLPLRRYSNRAPTTTLNGAISSSDTSVTVGNASGFPPPPFTIAVEGEVMLVTNTSSNTFTVTRAYDGSVAASAHADAVEVKHVLTADDFDHRWQDVIVTPPYGTLDDEFDDGDDSGLGSITQGTAAWTEENGVLSVVFSGQAVGEVDSRVKTISTLGIGTGLQTAVRLMGAANYAIAGPLFAAGGTTTDNVIWQALEIAPGSNLARVTLRSGRHNAVSTTHYSDQASPILGGWLHMRLVWVSISGFRAWWSLDGVSWTNFGKGVSYISGISPPTRMGVGVSSWGGSGDKLATFEYLRVWEP